MDGVALQVALVLVLAYILLLSIPCLFVEILYMNAKLSNVDSKISRLENVKMRSDED